MLPCLFSRDHPERKSAPQRTLQSRLRPEDDPENVTYAKNRHLHTVFFFNFGLGQLRTEKGYI